MATVSKEIADDIIAGKYPDDTPARRIVKYTDMNGGEAYGVIYEGQRLDYYRASAFVHNPVVYWEAK